VIDEDIVLRSEVVLGTAQDCLPSTIEVEYSLDGSSAMTSQNADSGFGFQANVSSGSHTLDAVATQLETDVSATDSVDFALRTADDIDGNGYLDDPFGELNRDGDRWIADSLLGSDPRSVQMLVWAKRCDGMDPDTPVRVYIENPTDANQLLTVAVNRDILACGEIGILIVSFADTLHDLLGSDADSLGTAPEGAAAGAAYFDISVIVSDDDGASFSEIAGTRLADRPVEIALNGLNLAAGTDYTFYAHPSNIVPDTPTGFSLEATGGSWNREGVTVVNSTTTSIAAEVTRLSVFGVFAAGGGGPSCAPGGSGQHGGALGDVAVVLLALGTAALLYRRSRRGTRKRS